MRTLLFACLFLVLPTLAFAGDLNIWNDWNHSPGGRYKQRADGFTKFNHGIPQFGDFYKKRSDGTYLRYKNWQPQFGDKLKKW